MITEHLQFIKEIDQLKNVLRKTSPYHHTRFENSAEHSWHLALSVLVLNEYANEKVDILRCLKMALIHDLVEIEGGDQIVYNEDPDKFERELQAAKNIFSHLNPELEKELLELWIEFEKKQCPESKFVGALDRYLPLMSNLYTNGEASWKKHGVTEDMVYEKNGQAIRDGSMKLWEETSKGLESYFLSNK